MRLLLFLMVLVLGLPALAQDLLSARGGQFLTVRVQGASADITAAQLDLNASLRGIELHSQGDGVWTGGFVLLPTLVSGTIRPQVRLYREDVLAHSAAQDGVSVQMASSDLGHTGLAVALTDRGTTFVYGATIQTASINFLTGDGYAAPELSANTFTLPGRVLPEQVSAIVAQTIEGVDLVFSPHWGSDTLPAGKTL